MLDHLLDFEPPVHEHSAKAVKPLEKISTDETLNAQINTTAWLEKLGVDDDDKALKEANAKAAQKEFELSSTFQPAISIVVLPILVNSNQSAS